MVEFEFTSWIANIGSFADSGGAALVYILSVVSTNFG